MGLFGAKDCVCLCWSSEGDVLAVRAALAKGSIEILAARKSLPENNIDSSVASTGGNGEASPAAFGEKLSKALLELDPSGEAYAVAGGPVPGELVFELGMPSLRRKEDFASALEFELPRQAPANAGELVWRSRIVRNSTENDAMSIVRIWTAPKKEWERLLEGLSASDVKIDLLMNPLMAELPEGCSERVCMPLAEPGYMMLRGADGLACMEPVQNAAEEARSFAGRLLESFKIKAPEGFDATAYAPCLALAWHVLKGAGAKSEIRALEIPSAMRPKRFKALKFACLALLGLNAALALGYGGRLYYERWSRLGEIRAEKAAAIAKISKLRASNASNAEVDKSLKLIEMTSTGNGEALNCLQFLSETLPERVWLNDFSSGPDKIDLSIKGDGDWEAESVKWDKQGKFSAESIRKRRNPDGSAETSLRLACKESGGRG